MGFTKPLVEDAAIELFEKLGYAVGHEPYLALGEPAAERDLFGEALWRGRNLRLHRRTPRH